MVKYSATNLSLRNTRLSESEKFALYGQIYKQVLIGEVTRNLLLWFMSMESLNVTKRWLGKKECFPQMNTKQPKLNPEAQAVFDSIHVTVRMCRWFYECGLKISAPSMER